MLDQDITKFKVSELRETLKSKGLNTTGNKQELIERLQAALSDVSRDLDSKLEDELLNDDDHFLDEEKSLLDSTQDLLKSPDSSKSTTPETSLPVKKVTLKRNISIFPEMFETKLDEDKKTYTEITTASEPEKKIIKISELSTKDRLEMRAKKFGAGNTFAVDTDSVPPKNKLEARAARFGVTSVSNTSNQSSDTSSDVLKKRAERFGAISIDVKQTEYEEKMLKRKERFGADNKTNVTNSDYAEKARLRLERFKQTT